MVEASLVFEGDEVGGKWGMNDISIALVGTKQSVSTSVSELGAPSSSNSSHQDSAFIART